MTLPQNSLGCGAKASRWVLFSTLTLLWMLLSWGCSGGGGSSSGPTSPTAPANPPPQSIPGSATFMVVGAGYDATLSWGDSNTITCSRNAGFADLFIRFAEQSFGGGGSGPRVDMDICNLGVGGAFTAKDASSTSCAGKTFSIFWHDDNGVDFQNNLMSSPCQADLAVADDGGSLTGTFSCSGLVDFNGGPETLDILDGIFQCNIEQ